MKNLNRKMVFIIGALFIVPVFTIPGFAGSDCQRPCSKSSVRANMSVKEKAMLQKEEDRSIRPCAMVKKKTADPKVINQDLVECCKSNSVRKSLSGTALAMLTKAEKRNIRPCEFMHMKRADINSSALNRVSISDGYVYGSVRANLSSVEKTDLRREESH